MSRTALASWQPDMYGLSNKGQSDTKNVYATGAGYSPLQALAEISSTGLDAQAIGAISGQDLTGTTNTFAGDATKLYKLSAGVFSNVSLAGNYTVGTTERWEFAQYGTRIIATQIGAVPQYYDMSSSTLFANLGGSPPKARHIAVVRDFVVLGNTDTSPNQVRWSGFNNSDQWTVGVNQADSQTLQGGGWVQGMTGGEVGYIFQEHAITRMSYVGPPLYFQFDVEETNRGCAAPGSILKVGTLVFFYSQDGFYVKDGDSPSISIGNGKVDSWFRAHLAGNTFALITAGVDPSNKLVFWSFVSTDATDTSHPDTVLIYNWANQEWSYAKVSHEMLYPALTEGVTLEQIGLQYATLELVPVSFDSRIWTGGAVYIAAFDTSHQLCAFSGANLAATMQTADLEPVPGKRSLVTNVRPMCDTSALTAIVRSRERFADAVVDTSSSTMQTNGDIPLMSSGRFHQVELNIPAAATWTFANGVDVDAQDDGEL